MKPLEKRLQALEAPAKVMDDWSFLLDDDEEGPWLVERTMTHEQWIEELNRVDEADQAKADNLGNSTR